MARWAIVALRFMAVPYERLWGSSPGEGPLTVSLSRMGQPAWTSLHRLPVKDFEKLFKKLLGILTPDHAAAIGL
ncbi:hypothetical protein ABIF68_010776 [Bradyrhizobium japonicum]|uniref:Transposase n=2 Tax=Bradyrhizobium japonicum TaxID=375 RepID=A0ABV2S866_BRAJP|nr:hypothetical protein BJA01nite_80270 [Bradyrhizobium japonicum]GMO51498.1 hypothetical protein BwSH14_73210 [Bradyrhizobium ottawaense]GMO57960.1 hypothetical protein BwSF12_74810 [Bradyrhizobium ottawaense]GMO58899.1 hypothetical protein BwSG20_11720 [Bradyrhizobium ottawaense]GMP13767.1 hypothetical protein BwSH20_73450 [Bradyrhizobium ottawaense]